jgi:hypothetical protein
MRTSSFRRTTYSYDPYGCLNALRISSRTKTNKAKPPPSPQRLLRFAFLAAPLEQEPLGFYHTLLGLSQTQEVIVVTCAMACRSAVRVTGLPTMKSLQAVSFSGQEGTRKECRRNHARRLVSATPHKNLTLTLTLTLTRNLTRVVFRLRLRVRVRLRLFSKRMTENEKNPTPHQDDSDGSR